MLTSCRALDASTRQLCVHTGLVQLIIFQGRPACDAGTQQWGRPLERQVVGDSQGVAAWGTPQPCVRECAGIVVQPESLACDSLFAHDNAGTVSTIGGQAVVMFAVVREHYLGAVRLVLDVAPFAIPAPARLRARRKYRSHEDIS